MSRYGIQDRISEKLSGERLGLEVRRARRPFLQYLLLAAAFITAFALLLHELHQPAPWQSEYSFHVAVANADAVAPNDQVRVAGVQVGKVTAVTLDGGTPEITAHIAAKYAPLYRNARVELRPNTPLQDMYLDIVSRGTPGQGKIPSGGRIPVDQTESPVQIGQVIDLFDSGVRPRVTAAINALGAGLGDHGVQLREALTELAPFLQAARDLNQQLAVRRTETEQLVHQFAQLTGTVADRSSALKGLLTNGQVALQRVAGESEPLGQLLQVLPGTLAEVPRAFGDLDTASRQLTPTARALEPVAGSLAPALSSINRLAPPARRGLDALQSTLTPVRRLLGPLRTLSGSLRTSFTGLTPSLPKLSHVIDTLQPCRLAVQKFFQWTLSVSKLYSAAGDMQRGLGLVSAQSLGDTVGLNNVPSELQPARTCTGTLP